jgi:hypothetical protein
MPSAKVREFLEQAEHYRGLKDHAPDPGLRRILELWKPATVSRPKAKSGSGQKSRWKRPTSG